MAASSISVVIPTYRREQVLVETIEQLLALDVVPAEIIIVDQSETHLPDVTARLTALAESGAIRWLRLEAPSIPHAMNCGLLAAKQSIVLFLDDDIRPEAGLISAHQQAHAIHPGALVAGRVLQPWEEGIALPDDGVFRFSGLMEAWLDEFMGGNFSLQRDAAVALGGFDENFVRVAYRFEAEFSLRWRASGRRIRFAPDALIHHLKAGGGTRSFGDFLRTWRPDHAVGAYYFVLRACRGVELVRQFATRFLRSVGTRHHLLRPWWIPATLVAESTAMLWAIRLALSGPRYVRAEKKA